MFLFLIIFRFADVPCSFDMFDFDIMALVLVLFPFIVVIGFVVVFRFLVKIRCNFCIVVVVVVAFVVVDDNCSNQLTCLL